jgi:hypothetical protein
VNFVPIAELEEMGHWKESCAVWLEPRVCETASYTEDEERVLFEVQMVLVIVIV